MKVFTLVENQSRIKLENWVEVYMDKNCEINKTLLPRMSFSNFYKLINLLEYPVSLKEELVK